MQTIEDVMSADTDAVTKPASPTAQPAQAPAPSTDVASTKTAPAAGNSGEPQTPADGQPAAVDGKKESSTDGSKATPKEEAPLSQSEIDRKAKELLGLENVEPDTADHWKKKYEASSKEGREKAGLLNSVNEKLAALGLKVVHGEKGVEFLPDEKFTATKTDSLLGSVYDTLSQDEKDMALENPKKFAQLVVSKTLQATQRPVPTADPSSIRIPESVRAEARQEVVAAKSKEDGRKSAFPDFEALEPYINAMMADPSTPKEFTDFAMRSKDNFKYALTLLYGRVHHSVAPLIAAQLDRKAQLEKKKEQSLQDASLTSEGTRSGRAKMTSSAKAEAEEVVNAKAW